MFAIAVTILATASCDSEQPATTTSAAASLTVSASAQVDNNWCWDMWFDEDGVGGCEFDLQQKFCQVVDNEAKNSHPVPWRYTVQVSVIRAGQTTPQVIGSSVVPNDNVQDFVSLTPYDPVVSPGIPKANDGQICYLNGVTVSRGTQTWLQANGYDIGTPNILETNPSFDFELQQGDTVIVEARKQSRNDAPNFLQDPEDLSDADLILTGTLTVAGGSVLVNGTQFSPTADKAGFSFSYTRR